MGNRKKKILFAATDVNYRFKLYSDFIENKFNHLGTSETFSKYILPESHFKTSYTYELPINNTPKYKFYFLCFSFFIYSLFRYNTFHFLSGETILTRKLRRFELITYKILRKKVIMHFVGADIRSSEYLDIKRTQLIESLKFGLKDVPLTEKYQNKLIKDAKKYASKIIVSTPDLLEIIPEADYLPVFLNQNEMPDYDSSDDNGKITIMHSPTSSRVKGSEYIYPILNEISLMYNDKIQIFTPKHDKNSDTELYALTRRKLLEKFTVIDIVIDQMLIGWYGLKSIEALYFGCEVISYIDKKSEKFKFPDSPIVCSDVLNLKDDLTKVIEKLLSNKNRKDKIKSNREWINQYHNIDSYEEYLKDLWFKK